MSEQDTVVPEEVIEDTIDPAEQEARSQGWKPKEEFITSGGEEHRWVEAGEFNRRKEFFDALHKVNRENKALTERVSSLVEHNAKIEKVAYDRAINDLRAQRKEAAKSGDTETVVAISEELEKLTPPPAPVPVIDPLKEFANNNPWYLQDEDLQNYANGVGARIERANPNMSVNEVLEKVVERTKAAFPHKFGKTQPNTVVPSVMPSRSAAPSPAASKKKKITYEDLDSEGKKFYNTLVRPAGSDGKAPKGFITPEKYLKDFAAISGLKYED